MILQILQVDGLMRPGGVSRWGRVVPNCLVSTRIQTLPIQVVTSRHGPGLVYLVGPYADGAVLISSRVLIEWNRIEWGATHWGASPRPSDLDLLRGLLECLD